MSVISAVIGWIKYECAKKNFFGKTCISVYLLFLFLAFYELFVSERGSSDLILHRFSLVVKKNDRFYFPKIFYFCYAVVYR